MATTLQIQPIPPPLTLGKDGAARVGGTRVTLDTVVRAFTRGATAEEIAQQYPSLNLSDIYATISYYLQHQISVDAYLRERGLVHDETRRHNESRFDPEGVSERLLNRKNQSAS